MHRNLLSGLVVALLMVGCYGIVEAPTTTFPAVSGPRIDDFLLSAVFSGAPVAAGRHPEGEYMEVAVDEVFWNPPSFTTTTKEVISLTPMHSGDRVITFPDVQVEIGERYLLLAAESGIGGEVPQWNAIWVFKLNTMQALQSVQPPIDSILFPSESGPAAIRTALVELVDQAFQAREAENLGHELEAGKRLAMVRQLRGVSNSAPINPALGMSIGRYLSLAPKDRNLLEAAEMPPEVMAALDLVPVLIVVLNASAIDDEVYLGYTTPVGMSSLFEIPTDSGSMQLFGTRPRTGGLKLIGWGKNLDLGSNYLEQAIPIPVSDEIEAGLGSLRPEDQRIVIDLRTGSFRTEARG